MKQTFINKYGPWAVVTGASSGIGAEFAQQLAQKGMNLVLVARRKERLEELANMIENQYTVKVKYVVADLTQVGFLDEICKTTDTLEIGLLVNNAGAWVMGEYLTITMEEELRMIDLNIKAPAILTHHFATQMMERKRGGILNVASMLAYVGVPYSAVYAATKAYELVKSESLWHELKHKGVDVLSLNPGLTQTEMTSDYDFSHMPMGLMSTTKVVKAGLSGLGRKSQVIPGVKNKLLGAMSKRIMSRDMNTKMFGMLMGITMNKLNK